ncbi:MAG: DNA gyrase inhibitor YacG [Planctomycetota bacterium]|nr:DNA gyrase inhibitor YacG [Planctomycetota bacterium]
MTDATPNLREGRCPRCGKRYRFVSLARHKPFPFCSSRCRNEDLGRWMRGDYVISSPLPRLDDEVALEAAETEDDPDEG